jgi:hypothetical protein
MQVKAITYFLGDEGMWRPGDMKEVSEARSQELLKNKLVELVKGETEAAQVVEVSPIAKRETKPLKRKLEKK